MNTSAPRFIRNAIKPFEFPLYFVTGTCAFYLAGANVLRGAKWPSEGFWEPWSVPFIALLGTAVYVPLYALYKALDAHYEGRDRTEAETDHDLQVVCQRVVSGIADSCPGVEINDLGAHVWLCRPDGSFDRRARFLLPEARKRSGVRWARGKGVAGMAWEDNEDFIADLRPLHDKVGRLSAEEFDALPKRDRHGLTASEVKSTLTYTGVCAIRLFVENDFVGVFVIDYTGHDHFDCVAQASGQRPVSTAIAACEERLGDAPHLL